MAVPVISGPEPVVQFLAADGWQDPGPDDWRKDQ